MKRPSWVRKYAQAACAFLPLIANHPPFIAKAQEIRKQFPRAGEIVSPFFHSYLDTHCEGDDYLQAVIDLTCDLNLSKREALNWKWIQQIHNLIWNEPTEALLTCMWDSTPIRITLTLGIDPRSSWTEVRKQFNEALEEGRDKIESVLKYSKQRPSPKLQQAAKWLFQRVVLNKKPREIWLNELYGKEDGEDVSDVAVRKAISEMASLLSVKL